MKRSVRTALIVAAVLFGTGIVLLLGASAFITDPMELNTMDFEEKNHTVTTPFSGLDIQAVESDIRLVPAEDGICRVTFLDSDKVTHTVTVEQKTLVIRRIDTRRWYERIGIYWGDFTVTVYLPEQEYEKAILKTVSGDINVPTSFRFAEAEVQSTSGEIRFTGAVNGPLTVQSTSGDVCLSSVTAGDTLVKTVSGELELNLLSVAALSAHTTSGDVDWTDVAAVGKAVLYSVSGDVKLTACDAAELEIKTTSGDVRGILRTAKNFVTDTTSGTVRVPASDFSAGICSIKTTSGDVKIEVSP